MNKGKLTIAEMAARLNNSLQIPYRNCQYSKFGLGPASLQLSPIVKSIDKLWTHFGGLNNLGL